MTKGGSIFLAIFGGDESSIFATFFAPGHSVSGLRGCIKAGVMASDPKRRSSSSGRHGPVCTIILSLYKCMVVVKVG